MTHRLSRARSTVLAVALVAASVVGCSTAEEPVSADTSSVAAQQNAEATSVDTGVSDSSSTALVPTRIDVPAIDVSSDLMGLGLQADGTMQVPPGGFPAGWFTGSPVPGELGPAVVAGHVDWDGAPGVFSRLGDLEDDDVVTVTRSDGSASTFRVTDVEQYPKSEFPTEAVYGDIDRPGIRLITCGGEFDSAASSYDDNVVVYADLVSTTS
ncbi:class F sortase [Rhodococcus sp. MEB064]|uniref:class F sortase n=1 Tax=Rhodococcus sp. MEB064 TaxID=1587522 RepID=UPI000698F410|nr:class F sortase [Rhodococcus sp. MEB064]